MERSTIKLLKKRGCNHTEIAKVLGRDRKTIRRVLQEPANQQQRSPRGSLVDPYEAQIRAWLEAGLPVNVMLHKARELASNPYSGGRTAFYEGVRRIRETVVREAPSAIWRFEGLPGEYLQVDWGEKSPMPFTALAPQKRYCFVARLKYSRWLYVEWQTNTRLETLIRCLLRCFEALEGIPWVLREALEGIPWVLRFDNMGSIINPRQRLNEDGSPNWRPPFIQFASDMGSSLPIWAVRFRYGQFASDMGFHPELCDVAAPNQKGTVENGVKFVKNNFLPGRCFRDDADLAAQTAQWQQRVNSQPCQAHGKLPEERLQEERKAFEALPTTAEEYGLLHQLPVTLESVVRLETNRYSVPKQLMGRVLPVRVASKKVLIYHRAQLVASHPRCFGRNQWTRCFGRNQWIRDLTHYTKTFEGKPKAKLMAYREKLLELDTHVARYITTLSRSDRNTLESQILKLYALWQQVGTQRFTNAVRACQQRQVYGADYVLRMATQHQEKHATQQLPSGDFLPSRGFTADPPPAFPNQASPVHSEAAVRRQDPSFSFADQPEQSELDRDLSSYEVYVHGAVDSMQTDSVKADSVKADSASSRSDSKSWACESAQQATVGEEVD